MIAEVLRDEIIDFILEHENDDVHELLLKYKVIHGIPATVIIDQIKGKQKAKEKLPVFYWAKSIVYPKALNLEQSSSEQAAGFKLEFVRSLFDSKNGGIGVDLTGGMGVDTFFLSKAFKRFHYVEPNSELYALTRHNLNVLNGKNIVTHNATAEEFLNAFEEKSDFIFIDPSRRDEDKNKVYSLKSGQPDITTLQDKIFQRTDKLLIKSSPILDLQQGLRELNFVKKIMVVSLENECKEVLYYAEKNSQKEPTIHAFNINKGSLEEFEFTFKEEKDLRLKYAEPARFLYEPNASLLKAGAFKSITKRFQLEKLHSNTHLYTSPDVDLNFPGRVFRIISHVKADPSSMLQFFPDKKANVIVRNYPLSTEELKKKTKIKDGGEKYLIGFTHFKGKCLVAADRIK